MAWNEALAARLLTAIAQQNFVDKPPAYLDCGICFKTMVDPVSCTSGKHTFCKACIPDHLAKFTPPACPFDQEPFASPIRMVEVPVALKECIKALPVSCATGCGWKGAQGAWPNHLVRNCSAMGHSGKTTPSAEDVPGVGSTNEPIPPPRYTERPPSFGMPRSQRPAPAIFVSEGRRDPVSGGWEYTAPHISSPRRRYSYSEDWLSEGLSDRLSPFFSASYRGPSYGTSSRGHYPNHF